MSYISYMLENEVDTKIDMDENLYEYIVSSLFWVRTFWSDGEEHAGFDSIGISIVNEDIGKLKRIVIAWKNLFLNAPETIDVITGYDVHGNLDIIGEIDKKECLSQLKKIAELCDSAILQEKNIMVCGL